MLRISVLILLITLLPFSAFAADAVPGLKTVLGVTYNPSLAEVSKTANTDIFEKTDVGLDKYIILTTKISEGNPEKYVVAYTGGMSGDPMFIFHKSENSSPKALTDDFWGDMEVHGTKLVIPGDGYIYVSGHTDNMSDEHRKYKIENDKLVEVKQPFYYIGLDTVALRPFTIYLSEDKKDAVADISVGEKISVVLGKPVLDKDGYSIHDKELFLIKTKDNLTGWFEIPADGQMYLGTIVDESPNRPYFDGIFYNGD